MKIAGIHLDIPGRNFLDPEPEEPIGLEYVMAAAEDDGHNIRLFFDWQGKDKLLDEIIGYDPDVVLLEVYTKDFIASLSLCQELKEKKKDLTIVVGGYHPTALPQQTLLDSNGSLDVVVYGEGEDTLKELLHCIEEGSSLEKVKGIAYLENDNVKINAPRELIADLDSIRWPVRAPQFYDLQTEGCLFYPESSRLRYAPIVHSRGCVRSCYFCSSNRMWGRRPRFRSPSDVVAEMNHVHKNHRINMFFIEDLSININERRLFALCDEMEKRLDPDIYWSSCANIGLSKALLTKMRQAKCVCLCYGVETLDPLILKDQKKRQSALEIKRSITETANVGIIPFIFYMIGFEHETEESIRKAFRELCKLPGLRLRLTFATPFPGTEWYEDVNKNALDKDWSKFDTAHPVMDHPYLAKQRLLQLRHELLVEFYTGAAYKDHVDQFLSLHPEYEKSFSEFWVAIDKALN
ncbi:MAG: radical SAM protein [Candidatus Abyssobacteria bacterium SURF_5]|uniref:Radical SAM protein n=1 Tax=Abyssobacteria bacterium (strain SURF_5) TaxID=2093360 RepID=A0A3A4NBT7_ABYX5|nr:MAG: radical SAM protein [Candidatus Abyssubacteria bacterium SURF_5]